MRLLFSAGLLVACNSSPNRIPLDASTDAEPADAETTDASNPDASIDSGVRATYAKVPFLEVDPGLIVEVSFAGSAPALMRYDTGSPSTYLDTDFGVAAGLASGLVDATIGSAAFGQRPLTLIQWLEAEYTYAGLPGPIQGLLGNDFFDGFAVGVDHRDEILWFTEAPSEIDVLDRPTGTSDRRTIVPFTIESNYLVMRCGFDGAADNDCLFDFGALSSLAFESVWSSDPPALHTVPFFGYDNTGAPLVGYYQRMRSLHAGDLVVPGDYALVVPQFGLLTSVGNAIGRELTGIVGLESTLGYFTVVDYPNQRLLFYPYEPPPPPVDLFRGFGFVVGTSTDGANLRVVDVVPASDAELQGVEDGDLILRIDGAPLGATPIRYTLALIIAGAVGERRNFTFRRGATTFDLEITAEDLLPIP